MVLVGIFLHCQVPDASISLPAVTGTMPDVSGGVSAPSAGGVDVDVAAPSVDVEASLPSASIDMPGEYKTPCFCFMLSWATVAPEEEHSP